MKLRTQMLDDYDSDKFGLKCEDPSLAQQSQAEDADINVIVKRMKVGIDPPFTARVPLEGEFLDITDYREALHITMEAERAFNQLPAAIRARFENDPAQFLDFFYDPKNTEEAIRLGLATARPTPVPQAPKEPPVETTPAK